MQARVQELEKLLEEKDNACLRGLNRGYSKSQGDDVLSAQRLSNQAGATQINAPRTSLSDQPARASTLSHGWDVASPQGKVPDIVFKLPGFGEVS
jgi:hypothetical protein